jgi:hypothetical protein
MTTTVPFVLTRHVTPDVCIQRWVGEKRDHVDCS